MFPAVLVYPRKKVSDQILFNSPKPKKVLSMCGCMLYVRLIVCMYFCNIIQFLKERVERDPFGKNVSNENVFNSPKPKKMCAYVSVCLCKRM